MEEHYMTEIDTMNMNGNDTSENNPAVASHASSEGGNSSHSEHHSHHHSHHSHGVHGHHHHHHSSHKRRRKKTAHSNRKEKMASFLRRNKHYLIYTAMTFAFLICLVLLGGHMDRREEPVTERPGEQQTPSDTEDPSGEVDDNAVANGNVLINMPLFSGDVDIVSPAVRTFMNLDESISHESYYKQAGAQMRLDTSLPVNLSYKITEIADGHYVKTAKFVVADNAEFSNPYVVQTNAGVTEVDIYNLKTDTQYYYRIELLFTNGSTANVGGSFHTAAGPRLIMVDGVRNIRDVGGWITTDGLTVKEGLLYRGRELDGAVRSDYAITAQGVHTMLTQLGIKTDLDLRQPTDNKYGTDALGQSVKHVYYSAPMYANIFNGAENGEKIRQIFSDLADPSIYPAYLHCTHGVDRTGTVCYLLGALLGVDADSLLMDYQMSILAHGELGNYVDEFIAAVDQLPGATLREKVEGYLLSIGVTSEEIASIRQIFLEY
jgi:protein tyrosine/serine phosphatase